MRPLSKSDLCLASDVFPRASLMVIWQPKYAGMAECLRARLAHQGPNSLSRNSEARLTTPWSGKLGDHLMTSNTEFEQALGIPTEVQRPREEAKSHAEELEDKVLLNEEAIFAWLQEEGRHE